MELVKKQLEENGYAYFNMNDYDMFADDLKNYSKYICNETNNLKEYISGIRVDVIAKDEFKHEFENGKMQIQKEFLNFEEAKLAMIEADSKMHINKHSFQKWFFGHGNRVNAELQLLSSKIVKNIYIPPKKYS